MSKIILVTSALPYANGSIHLGHMAEKIQADIWVRFQRCQGHTCHHFCADDAHGTPVMLSAQKLGLDPAEYVKTIQAEHQADFEGFGVDFAAYHSTHSAENQVLSHQFYAKMCEKKALREQEVAQCYCPKCAMFLPDRFVKGDCPRCHTPDQYGDSCENCAATYDPSELINAHCATCGSSPEVRKSTHLFFKLAEFEAPIRAWLNSGAVRPEIVNKLDEWFTQGLKDWCISRDAPYFGFEIPDKPGKYFYVWVDAPIGYLASMQIWAQAQGQSLDSLWTTPNQNQTKIYHFIGKDILYFHTLFWPAMLHVADLALPNAVFVHGFLTVNGEKMSKSRGTFINAGDYLAVLPPEYLRYYLASKLNPTVEDLDFGVQDFVFKVNADIVNKVVNIGSRLGSVLHKKCGGALTTPDPEGQALLDKAKAEIPAIAQAYEALDLALATRKMMAIADDINKFIDEKAPWSVANTDPALAAQVCTTGLNGLYLLAGLLQPITPQLTQGILAFLEVSLTTWSDLSQTLTQHPIQPYQHLAKRLELGVVEGLLGK